VSLDAGWKDEEAMRAHDQALFAGPDDDHEGRYDEAYDASDPKHPDFHGRWAHAFDCREGK
jgi:hypothetical protein